MTTHIILVFGQEVLKKPFIIKKYQKNLINHGDSVTNISYIISCRRNNSKNFFVCVHINES